MVLNPILVQDTFKDDLSEFEIKFNQLTGISYKLFRKEAESLSCEPDEVAYKYNGFILYQDAYDQEWQLYTIQDINDCDKSHLKRFV